jgi:hypothetical protein
LEFRHHIIAAWGFPGVRPETYDTTMGAGPAQERFKTHAPFAFIGVYRRLISLRYVRTDMGTWQERI